MGNVNCELAERTELTRVPMPTTTTSLHVGIKQHSASIYVLRIDSLNRRYTAF